MVNISLNTAAQSVTTASSAPYSLVDLEALYLFSGNANDSSPGGGSNGSLVGGASVADDFLLLGDNDDDAFSIPSTILDGKTNFTIASWIKIDTPHPDNTGGELNTLISFANSADANHLTLAYWVEDEAWKVVFRNVAWLEFTNSKIFMNQNYHIALVKDNLYFKLYINAVLKDTVTAIGIATLDIDSGGFIIGQDQDGPGVGGNFEQVQSLAGRSDTLFVYSRALSQSDIEDCMNFANDIPDLNIITNGNTRLYYKHQSLLPNGGLDRLLVDHSGNANDAIAFNVNSVGDHITLEAPIIDGDIHSLRVDNSDFGINDNRIETPDDGSLDITDKITFDVIFRFNSFRNVAQTYNPIVTKYNTQDFNGDNGQSYNLAYDPTITKLYISLFDTTTSDIDPKFITLETIVTLLANTTYVAQVAFDSTNKLYNIVLNGVDKTVTVDESFMSLAGFTSIKVSNAEIFQAALKFSGGYVESDMTLEILGIHAEYRNAAAGLTTYNIFAGAI